MEIISKIVKINVELPTNNKIIESELEKKGIIPLRWAIVGVDKKNSPQTLTISVAYANL